jgi:Endonuclease/Exonuclease/phosphatase family
MSRFTDNKLRIVEFNVENLFILLDHYDPLRQTIDFSTIGEKDWQRLSSSTTRNKPIAHVRQLARAIIELDPDILMLCEVGGRESLANFSQYFLQNRYAVHLLEGNSDRGIDLGYLVKRDLGFTYDLLSHKHRSIDFLYPHERQSQETGFGHLRSAQIKSHRFSRDVLELRIFDESPEVPALILLLVHLKSQLDRNRVDPGGRDRRRAELVKLIKIYKEIHDEFSGKTPIILGGDFNGVASRPNPDEEFHYLYEETHLRDVLDIADVTHEERFTHQQIYRNRNGVNRQLDYIFVPQELAARVNGEESWIYRYRDENGMTQIIPKNLNEKKLLPSDHYPVVLTLNAGTR